MSLPHTYAKLINASIANHPADMTMCLHVCRGNAGGGWLAEGGYEPAAETLFNEIGVTGYFLEYDSTRAGSFEPLQFLPIAVLGLVSTRTNQLVPAPYNLPVPPYHFVNATTLRIGANPPGETYDFSSIVQL